MIKKQIIFLNHLCRNCVVVSGGSARLVNGILGLLCRQHFPSIITCASKTEPAYSFDHYAVAPDAADRARRVFNNKAERVKQELWVNLPRTTLLNTSHSLDFS